MNETEMSLQRSNKHPSRNSLRPIQSCRLQPCSHPHSSPRARARVPAVHARCVSRFIQTRLYGTDSFRLGCMARREDSDILVGGVGLSQIDTWEEWVFHPFPSRTLVPNSLTLNRSGWISRCPVQSGGKGGVEAATCAAQYLQVAFTDIVESIFLPTGMPIGLKSPSSCAFQPSFPGCSELAMPCMTAWMKCLSKRPSRCRRGLNRHCA